MVFDSLIFDVLAAFVLFATCVTAWWLAGSARAASRVNIRFAAMLLAALAVARLLGVVLPQFAMLAPAVALIAASLAGTLLSLALFAFLARPLPVGVVALALAIALAMGLAGALAGAPVYAAACQLAGVLLVLAAGFQAFARWEASLSLLAALSLLCGGFCLMDGAINLADMFFAAALIGASSQTRVETEREGLLLAAIKTRG